VVWDTQFPCTLASFSLKYQACGFRIPTCKAPWRTPLPLWFEIPNYEISKLNFTLSGYPHNFKGN
jgi:hypothetical protein